jgi:glycosyltransferase involved in cell wall biosynthesis
MDARQSLPLLGVFDLVTSVGGVQKVMVSLLPHLRDRFRVAVIDPYQHPEYARLLASTGVESVAFGTPPERRFIGGSNPLERARRLAERAPFLLRTGLRLREWMSERAPALLYVNQLRCLSFFSRFVPPHGPRVVYHAHGFNSAADIHGGPRLARTCARILAVSNAVAKMLFEAGIDRSMISVVPNGVDSERIRASARRALSALPTRSPGEVVIVQVAVLAPNKQQHLSIDALARLPSYVTLWLCGEVPEGGDASYLEQLRRRAAELNVASRVHLLGWRDDVPAVIAASDICVLPSLEESFGMVLAEAMALSKPCVGTMAGGIPEVIEHGESGFVTASDPVPFTAALAHLVHSAEARARMGSAGRARVERLFSLDRQAREVKAALLTALAGDSCASVPGIETEEGRAHREEAR